MYYSVADIFTTPPPQRTRFGWHLWRHAAPLPWTCYITDCNSEVSDMISRFPSVISSLLCYSLGCNGKTRRCSRRHRCCANWWCWGECGNCSGDECVGGWRLTHAQRRHNTACIPICFQTVPSMLSITRSVLRWSCLTSQSELCCIREPLFLIHLFRALISIIFTCALWLCF